MLIENEKLKNNNNKLEFTNTHTKSPILMSISEHYEIKANQIRSNIVENRS